MNILGKNNAEELAYIYIQKYKQEKGNNLKEYQWYIQTQDTLEFEHAWIVFYNIKNLPSKDVILGGLPAILIDKNTGYIELIAQGTTMLLKIAIYEALNYPRTYNDLYPTINLVWNEDIRHIVLNLVPIQPICKSFIPRLVEPYQSFDMFDGYSCLTCMALLGKLGSFCQYCGILLQSDEGSVCRVCHNK